MAATINGSKLMDLAIREGGVDTLIYVLLFCDHETV